MGGVINMDGLKVASLFCGCGGTDVGFLGGFNFLGTHYPTTNVNLVYANDVDQSASDIFNENFDIKVDVRDIKLVKSEELPDHDILTGGFPCQSFSIVAQNPKRLGFKDEKGRLFFEMCRVLKEKQPCCFIAENVKGILSANQGKAFPLILQEFENSGYRVKYALLNAANYGVPQRRERVFIVGFRKDLNINYDFPLPVLSENNHVPLSSVIFNNYEVDKKYHFSEKALSGLAKANPQMGKGRHQDISRPCNTVGSHLAKVSLNSTDPVLKTENGYRRFTPREVARIQSFPDTFQLVGSDSAQYRALGNAIPPVLMWYVAKSVLVCLDQTENKNGQQEIIKINNYSLNV